jgi:hypothetical protein
MSQPIVAALHAFTDARSEEQLQALDAAIRSIDPLRCGKSEVKALLGIFERFPEQDGFGVFWGILHVLEACRDYEPELVASVQRKPCEFNVLMVNRLLNAGVTEVSGSSLEDLLLSARASGKATSQALHDIEHYLARRAGEGEA